MLSIFLKRIGWQLPLVICLLFSFCTLLIAQNRPTNRQFRDTRYNVLATAFSPDGQTLAISRGTGDLSQRHGQVDLWEVETGKLKRVIKGFDGPVWSVSFSADSQTLISGSSEFRYSTLQGDRRKGKYFTEIKWWEVATGELKFKQTTPTDEPRVLMTATSADGKLLANAESYMRINAFIPSSVDAAGSDLLGRSIVSPMFATRTNLIDLNLLDARTGTVNRQLKGILKSSWSSFRGTPNSLAGLPAQSGWMVLSPSGDLIAIGMSEEVKVWNTQSGELLLKLKKFKGNLRSLTFSPDGKVLGLASVVTDSNRSGDKVTYTFSSDLNFYEVKTGKLIKNFKYKGNISFLSFMQRHEGLLFGVTEFDGTRSFNVLRHVSLETGKVSEVVDHQRGARAFVLSPNEQTLAFMNGPLSVILWDLKKRQARFRFDEIRDEGGEQNIANRYVLDVKRVLAVSFSADGKTLAAGTEGNEIKIWDPRTGALKQKLKGHEGGVFGVALSGDGKQLISSGEESIRLWDVQTGAQEGFLADESGSTAPIAVSPDGKTAVGSQGPQLLLWDVQSRTLQKTIDSLTPSPLIAVTFSSNGQNLLTANESGVIQIWDIRTGEIIKAWETANKIMNLSLAPDGRVLACATDDGLVSIWDVRTGSLIKTLDKHDSAVNSLTFSPDGKWMASGGDDRKIFVWETSTWKSKHTMKGLDLTVTSLAFSPDGGFLASGSGNISVVLWNVETGKLERILK